MAGDLLKHVQSGQRLEIPAGTYNRLMDMLGAWLSGRLGGQSGVAPANQDLTTILVENQVGEDLEPFDIVGLKTAGDDRLWPTPTINEDAFLYSKVVFGGALPSVADHAGRFAVVLEPLEAGAIGRAAIAGLVPVYVAVQDSDDWWADINDGEHTTLASGKTGAAQLLYKESGEGLKWCLARLGSGALPPGDTDYQVPVWDNTKKQYVPGPCRAM